MKFQIEGVFKVTNVGYLIVTECLEEDYDYMLTENSKLGNIEITNRRILPQYKDNNDITKMNEFTFQLKNDADFDKLKVGEIVSLTN